MKATFRGFGLLCFASLLLLLPSCSGKSSGPSASAATFTIPKVTAPTISAPASTVLTQLGQYQAYTFQTTGTVTSAGASIASYSWNMGDGSTVTTTTVPTYTHPFMTAGTYTVSVTATDSNNMTSLAGTQAVTVVAGTNPITVLATAPTAALNVPDPLGSSATVTYGFTVADSDSGTVAASGITFNANDSTATLGALTAGTVTNGVTSWTISVTYPAAATAVPRTNAATVQVVDSLGVQSIPLTFAAVTINTTPLTSLAPTATLAVASGLLYPTPTATPNTTYQNDPVPFTGSASDLNTPAEPLSYTVTFGDGGTGDIAATALDTTGTATFSHTYAKAGNYTVTFTASNGIPGGTKAVTLTVVILPNSAPTLKVVQTPSGTVYANVLQTFTAATTDADGDAVTVAWDFGDALTPPSPLPTGGVITHTFTAAGTDTVTATATDGKGGITIVKLPITIVGNQLPTATVTTAAASLMQQKVYTFAATATDPDSGDSVSQFIWNFGDGTATVTSAPVGTGQTETTTVTHAFPSTFTGPAAVTVQAVDSHGAVGNASPAVNFTILVTKLPVSGFVEDKAVPNTYNLTLAGTGTVVDFFVTVTDPNAVAADPTSYLPAATNVFFDPNDPTAKVGTVVDNHDGSYIYPVTYLPTAAAGTRIVNPTVYAVDYLGVKGLTFTLPYTLVTTAAVNTAPVVNLAATPSIAAGANATWQNVPVTFTATATDANTDPLTYTWNFGDGTILTTTNLTSALSTTHTFTSPNPAYMVTLTVDDGRANGKKIADLTMAVLPNSAPVISLAQSIPSGAPVKYQMVTFTATVTDADGDTPTVTWNFGDGSLPATGLVVQHQFLTSGQTLVSASADDGKGGVTQATPLTVVVNEVSPPTAQVTTAAKTLYQDRSYTFTATATDPNPGGSILAVNGFVWNFGDGTTGTSNPSGSGATATTTSPAHIYPATFSGPAAVSVYAVNTALSQGLPSPTVTFTVVATQLPVATFTTPGVAATYYVEQGASNVATVNYLITASDANASSSPLSVKVYPLGAGTPGTVITATSNGNGTYSASYNYPAASTISSTLFTPAVQVTDALGIIGNLTAGPVVTIQTIAANSAPPSVIVTTPAVSTTQYFAYQKANLVFTLTDPFVNPVSYTIQWKYPSMAAADITTGVQNDAGLVAGDIITPVPYQYTTPGTYTVYITASDTRNVHNTSVPRQFTIVVLANALPVATITAPQGSGILGYAVADPNLTTAYPGSIPNSPSQLPAVAGNLAQVVNYPNIVVIPAGGQLTFTGTVAPSTSGEAVVNPTWTFPNGNPSTFQGLTTTVTFAGETGKYVANLVEFQVYDTFGRSSDQVDVNGVPTMAPATNTTPYRMWVLVDGVSTQSFTTNLLYRQLGDYAGGLMPPTASISAANLPYATLPANGYGATLSIYQDGLSTSYAVKSANQATVTVPVRSNLPFYAVISPFTGATDTFQYAMQIPNKPGTDPGLEAVPLSFASNFYFQNTGATAPWNPTLNIFTAQGFGPEVDTAGLKTLIAQFNGNMIISTDTQSAGLAPDERWLMMPAETPLTTPVVFPDAQSLIGGFAGVNAHQSYDEWPVFALSKASNFQWGTPPTATASFSGNVMTLLSALPGGTITYLQSQTVVALGVTPGTYIVSLASGTVDQIGSTYVLSTTPGTILSEAITLNPGSVHTVTPGTPTNVGFNLNYAAYHNDESPTSTIFTDWWTLNRIEAFRVPANSQAPYYLSTGPANWNQASCYTNLVPAKVLDTNAPALTYYANLIQNGSNPYSSSDTTLAFSGGLGGFHVPYDPNAPGRPVRAKASWVTRSLGWWEPVFSYAEYLWSSVWTQPVVLNSAQLNTTDTDPSNLPTVTSLVQSSAASNAWPKVVSGASITPDYSYFDLTPNGGAAFGTTGTLSPIATGTALTPPSAPASTAVGHFYWTAFTPTYSSATGGLISRTWLASGVTASQPPPVPGVDITRAVTDPGTGWGFLPPQDTAVDKRDRNPDGSLAATTNNSGYRVTWFNPTTAVNGSVVPPDFYVVEITGAFPAPNTATTMHFLVPSNYPAPLTGTPATSYAASYYLTTTTASPSVFTDARVFLPSGIDPMTVASTGTYAPGATDIIAPGYCWFDVPAGLRPTGAATVTIFAMKSILNNHAPAVAGPRSLNRPDWLDGIKTAIANMKVTPSSGIDLTYAHKIPFNYPWDIVVVNSEAIPVH